MGEPPQHAPQRKRNRKLRQDAREPKSATRVATAATLSREPTTEELRSPLVFGRPLVASGDEPTARHNTALGEAVRAFVAREDPDDQTALEAFLQDYPDSPYRPSLSLNLADDYWSSGRFTQALRSYEDAWRLAKNAERSDVRGVADAALVELLRVSVRFADMERLEELLREAKDRAPIGALASAVSEAKQALWIMENEPHRAFRCAGTALMSIVANAPEAVREDALITLGQSQSSARGMSLLETRDLASKVGLDLRMAFRKSGSAFLTPAVVHLSGEHFAALLAESDAHCLIEDNTLGHGSRFWMSKRVLEEEASGYWLVQSGRLRRGWKGVSEEEGAEVWGRSTSISTDPRSLTPWDHKKGGPSCSQGLPVVDVHLLAVSLHIEDTPVGYKPPRGPAIPFTASYNQRDADQPPAGEFTYSHVGPKWTFNWLTYIEDAGAASFGNVTWYVGGGGSTVFVNPIPEPDPSATTFIFPSSVDFVRDGLSQALLKRREGRYEMVMPDGTKQIFAKRVAAIGPREKVFLTEVIDPSGKNSVTLRYTSQAAGLRLDKIVDALGYETRIHYDSTAEPLRVSRVTDPFGREARFSYNASGLLDGITDVIGLQATFSYERSSDFIEAMTTPYGTTRFQRGEVGRTRWLDIASPDGERERVEFTEDPVDVARTDPAAAIPQNIIVTNLFNANRNSYHWSKKAMREHEGDYAAAITYHFTESIAMQANRILEYIKPPLERKIWFNYDTQRSGTGSMYTDISTMFKPVRIARALDDGVTQALALEYDNPHGLLTRWIDPLGREQIYEYSDKDPLDLVTVSQKNDAGADVLLRVAYDEETPHAPAAVTDAAGQTSRIAYNDMGQIKSFTNPLGNTTTLTYDSDGFLTAVGLPGAGTRKWRIEPDVVGGNRIDRVKSITDPEGHKHRFEYDDLDRVTKATFPDGSTETYEYTYLDVTKFRDRGRRDYAFVYDSNRDLVEVTDPLSQVTKLEWCACGRPSRITDPRGLVTRYRYDIEGRIVERLFDNYWPDTYQYDFAAGRLSELRSAKNEVVKLAYFADNSPKSISYLGGDGEPAEPGVVRFEMDPRYARVVKMADAFGETNYEYNPVGNPASLGATLLKRVETPRLSAVTELMYDELSRVSKRSITSAVGNSTREWRYDKLGRIFEETNELGIFKYEYDGLSRRVAQVRNPNGTRTKYEWFSSSGELKSMRHLKGNSLIRRFAYDYDLASQITKWSESGGTDEARTRKITYDVLGRVVEVSERKGSKEGTTRYTLDESGNRIMKETTSGEPADAAETIGYFANRLNQLTSLDTASIPPDAPSRDDWKYDDSGNLIQDYFRTYEWDVAGQLRSIAYTGTPTRSEFDYDGVHRLVRVVEKDAVAADATDYVWVGPEICLASNSQTNVRYFPQGLIEGNEKLYYVRDHLGSVRALTDDQGVVRGSFYYDPWGVEEKGQAAEIDSFRFANQLRHEASGLSFTWFRVYDPTTGRWLSRDPIGEEAGLNLYTYAFGNPVSLVDPYGLFLPPALAGLAIGCAIGGVANLVNDYLFGCKGNYALAAVAGCVGGAIGALGGGTVLGGLIAGYFGGALTGYLNRDWGVSWNLRDPRADVLIAGGAWGTIVGVAANLAMESGTLPGVVAGVVLGGIFSNVPFAVGTFFNAIEGLPDPPVCQP
jgi:RHS repeat-associated protein